MPGNYSRIKIWSSGEILTAADLNGEFNNEINNAIPSSIDDYSTTVGQMQTQTNPFPSITPSQATSLAGELERLRYKIAQITGKTYWYEDPQTTLALLTQADIKMHIGLEYDGKYGGASSTTDVLAKLINQGVIINAASLTTADVAAADFDSANKKFGTYAYSCGAGNIHAFPGNYGNPIKGSFTGWFRNLAAGDYIAYNPLLGIELLCEGGAGHLRFKITEKTAATESTKTTNTVEGSSTRSGVSSFANVTAKWRLNDEGGTSTDLMELECNGSDEGTQLAAQDLDINAGTGGVWFFGAKRNDPSWDHFYAASGLPTAHSSAWTKTGVATESVSNGVLNVTTTTNGFYAKTGATVLTGVNLAAQTFEIKMRINSMATTNAAEGQISFRIRDDSLNRTIGLSFYIDKVAIAQGSSFESTSWYSINTRDWHTYRVTCSGSPSPTYNLYIDGVFISTGVSSDADATANDLVQFGDTDSTASTACDFDVEYVAYADEVAAPISANTQGNLDSLAVLSGNISDVAITTLQNAKVSDVFGSLPSYGPYLPPTILNTGNDAAGQTVTSTTSVDLINLVYYQAGDGETEFSYYFNSTMQGGVGNNFFAIDIDNDQNGKGAENVPFSPTPFFAVADDLSLSVTRTQILKVGLREIRPQVFVSSGTAQWQYPYTTVWLGLISKMGKL